MSVSSLALGYNSTIEIDTGSNDGTFSSSATIGGFTSGSLTLSRANPDSTNIDTGGYQGREYGIKSAAVSAECLDDQENDTAQDQLLADYEAGTKRWVRVRPRVGTGYCQWDFRAVIGSDTKPIAQGEIAKFTLALESDGTITKSDQSPP